MNYRLCGGGNRYQQAQQRIKKAHCGHALCGSGLCDCLPNGYFPRPQEYYAKNNKQTNKEVGGGEVREMPSPQNQLIERKQDGDDIYSTETPSPQFRIDESEQDDDEIILSEHSTTRTKTPQRDPEDDRLSSRILRTQKEPTKGQNASKKNQLKNQLHHQTDKCQICGKLYCKKRRCHLLLLAEDGEDGVTVS